jgi:hypothetical protein
MFPRILRFVSLPLLLILLWAVLRFLMLPVFHMPYAPRGNAVFSVVGLTFISCLYFGAMSYKVGGFGWLGTFLCGVTIGLWAQLLIFTATVVTLAAGIDTYYANWDALNLPEGTHATLVQAVTIRVGGVVIGSIIGGIMALIGRAVFATLAPRCRDEVATLE